MEGPGWGTRVYLWQIHVDIWQNQYNIVKLKNKIKFKNKKINKFRRLLRVPWTARRSNQSILKKISPGYLLEGLMLKLKLQYFGHLMRRVDSLEQTLMLGGIGGRRRRGRQKTKIRVYSPITSWQIDGKTMDTDYFLGLQNHCGQ